MPLSSMISVLILVCKGIGQGRITKNLGTFVNDLSGAFTVPDEKSIVMAYELLDTEGLYVGASTALNVVAAVELAQRLGKGESTCSLSGRYFLADEMTLQAPRLPLSFVMVHIVTKVVCSPGHG